MPLQPPRPRTNDEHCGDGGLLLLSEKIGHQGQRDLMFAGQTPSLAGEHGLVGEGSPTALTLDPNQQRWVNLQLHSTCPPALETQADNPQSSLATSLLTMPWRFAQQNRETALLGIELQVAMR